METNAIRLEVFKGADKQWYFRARATNGEIVADSEAYGTMDHALRAAHGTFPGVNVEVLESYL